MKFGKLLLAAVVMMTVAENQLYAQGSSALKRRDRWSMARTDGDQMLSVGVTMGTTGVGLDTRMILNPKWNLRFGGTAMGLNYTRNFDQATGKASAAFSKIHLLSEFKFSDQFRLVGGMAFYFQQGIIAEGQLVDGIHYADLDLTMREVNTLRVGIEWKRIAPYIGIGLMRDMPMGKFNVNVDLGTYYLSMPSSKWEASNTDVKTNLVDYKRVLDNHISGYRWYPVLNVNLNYVVR